jgi:endonuclease YncB( thermonuclease family)
MILIVLLFPSFLFAYPYRVTKVYDCDTIGIGGRGIEMKVSLVAIDAPEISKNTRWPGQPFSRQAKRYLSDLILNKSVSIERFRNNSSNHIIGEVYLGTRNINLKMVEEGLARVYSKKLPKEFNIMPYEKAEKKAKDAGKGIWSLGDRYMNPKNRQNIHGEHSP